MTAIRSKLGNLKAFARRWGWPRTLFHLIVRGGDYLGINVVVVRTRSTTADIGNPCDLPEIEFRQIDSSTLVRAISDPELDVDQEFVKAAIERGDLAFGAFDKSQLVSYVWRSMASAPHTDDLWVKVEQPYCYAYKSFTRTDYRGNHIVPGLILYSDQEMLKLGYTFRVGFVAITNFPSLAVGARMGSQAIGRAVYLHWFGRYFFFRSRQVADIGFEFFEPTR